MQALFVIFMIIVGLAIYVVSGMSVAMFFDLSGVASWIVQIVFIVVCLTFRMSVIPCAIGAWGLYEYFDWNPWLAALVCFPGIIFALLGGASAILTNSKR